MAQAVQKRLKDLTVYGANLMFKNFQGLEKQFNPAGHRNFSLMLDPDDAEAMIADGWNVKFLKAREGDDPNEPLQAHLPIKVRLDSHRPPKIVMITSRGQQTLDADMVGALDFVVMKNVDLIVNPSWWDFNGKQGYTAYCKSLYVTIEEDALELKYGDVPEIGAGAEQLAIESNDVWNEPLQDLGERREIEQGF
jgi:hypothetical protein